MFGFDNTGQLFEVTCADGKLAATNLTLPSDARPQNLHFAGAGSTTVAPLTPTK